MNKPLLLLAAFLAASAAATAPATAAEPGRLLEMLQDDLDWARIGVTPGHYDALLDYYRARKNVKFYFDRGDIPEIIAAIRRQLPGEIEKAVRLADEILAHRFQNSTNGVIVRRVQLPEAIDWDANPTDDPEFAHMLARSRFWQELGFAYTYTGDEKYAAEFARQLDSWLDQAPLPFSAEEKPLSLWWRTINTGIRMDTWMWVYQAFLRSPHMTPDLHARMLAIIAEHGRVLRNHHQAPSSNWCAMEMQGLMNLSVMFPEFKKAAQWRKYAAAELLEAIKTQVRPDGAQVEESPSYHNGCIRWFYEPMRLAKRNGIQFPDQYRDILRKMATYTLWTTGPDGLTVGLSDSDRDEAGPRVLATMAIEFYEPNFAWLAKPAPVHYWEFGSAAGKKLAAIPAAPPEKLAMTFPDAGYVVVRSDWTPHANYCIFDCGPRGGGHGHFDLLSLEIYSHGKLLIADPGRWLYANVPLRRRVVSTPAHNTVSINGANHEALEHAGDPPMFALKPYGHGHFGGSHRAYKLKEGRASIDRQVEILDDDTLKITDTVQAPEPVNAQLNWQFATTEVQRPEPRTFVVGAPGQPRALITVANAPDQQCILEDSTISRFYASKESAKRLRVLQNGANPVFITTIKLKSPDEE